MSWDTWPYHPPGSALTFPRDEGWHRIMPGGIANPSMDEMEWVYLNAHVREKGGSGRLFVVFAAYFTQGLRFLVVRGFDPNDVQVSVHTGTTVGLLKVSDEDLDMRFVHGGGADAWKRTTTAGGDPVAFASHLTAHDDAGAFSVELDITCPKAPYPAGGLGNLPFGRHGSFFYYSLTRQGVEGKLRLGANDGSIEEIEVEGEGWFDHQWGPFIVTPFRTGLMEEYEWMSIQLDNGDDIMLTTVWEPNGVTPGLPAYGGAGRVQADGALGRLVGSHRWRRSRFWESPETHDVYSAGWTFDAPEWNTFLTITPRSPDQLTPLVDAPPQGIIPAMMTAVVQASMNFMGSFWEGSCRVTGTVDGVDVTGNAFAELIKRYEQPHVRLSVGRSEPGLTVLVWHVTNPDEQVALRHRFYLERPSTGEVLVQLDDLEVPVAILDDPALPIGEGLVARVVSHSADQTLSGTTARTIILL